MEIEKRKRSGIDIDIDIKFLMFKLSAHKMSCGMRARQSVWPSLWQSRYF